MKTPITASLSLLALFAAVTASADGGSISFQGQITESACSVNAVPSAMADAHAQTIAPGISLRVAAENDACSRGNPAFTAQYMPLQASQTEVQDKVITITYN
ncbi:MAG: hypothetical protein AAAB16_00720 [Pseudomonas sp.]|uniref:hypothetical protein n=1 Tax=Pseudomonas sp. TaxID=306 RepID=UPI0030F11027